MPKVKRSLFIKWLTSARFAKITKVAVRVELLEQLQSCVVFGNHDDNNQYVDIPNSMLTQLVIFLQSDSTGGNRDNNNVISSDSLLNWNKTLEKIWTSLENEQEIVAVTASQSPQILNRQLFEPPNSDRKEN